VLLRTKGFPEEFTLSANASAGMLTTATFHERPTYDGGGTDYLGTDDGTRALPDEIRDGSPLVEADRFHDGYTPEQLADLGRLLPNNYNVYNETVPPDTGISVSLGDKFQLRGTPIGFLVSLSHGIDYGFRSEDLRRFVHSDIEEGGLALNNDFHIDQRKQTVGASGIFVASIEPEQGDSIRSTTLVLRITDDETALATGRSNDLGRDIERSRLQFVERQLIAEQIAGQHELEHLHKGLLEWRYAFSRATRAEPNRREYLYTDEAVEGDPPDFQISTKGFGNQQIWSDLADRMHDVGLDYTQPFSLWNKLEAKVKVGGTWVSRERELDTVRLTFRAPARISDEVRRQTPEVVWSEDNVNADDGWLLEDTTNKNDAYTADQTIQAAYAMATIPVTKRIEVTAGTRVERSRQHVTTFTPFAIDDAVLETELEDTDVLPSATAKLQLSDELTLRGAYGRTVTRPDFRELSESRYLDVITATAYVGNPELERGTIDNVDARAEYYFSTDELVSVSGFYKAFDKPIEQIDLGGTERAISWDNASSATNIGVELECRRRLGFAHEALDDVFAAVNVALIHSNVNLGEDAGTSTSKQRALQGQSPFVVNLQLGYDDPEGSGITAVLLYNVSGRRIRDVGRFGTPDVYEQPLHQVDLVYGHKLGGGWKLELKAKNLLDQAVEYRQGPKLTRRYKDGRAFSMSLGWSY